MRPPRRSSSVACAAESGRSAIGIGATLPPRARSSISRASSSRPTSVPSIDELERRLRARAQDSDDIIKDRMAKAADEMSHWAEYDYVVINHDIGQAFADVQAILAAERLRRERQTVLSEFVRSLQADI